MTSIPTRSHTFDGIQEFDNRLPNWWLWSFYLACIFSVFYWIAYHTLGTADLPYEAYLVEQREAAARMEAEMAKNPITNESLLKLADNPTFVADGRAIFQDPKRCAQCHNESGNGNIGPNLTDEFWVYGGTPMDIFTTILDGRPGGMLAHKQEGLGFVQRAVAYVLSIKNTKVPGKAPEENAKKEQ